MKSPCNKKIGGEIGGFIAESMNTRDAAFKIIFQIYINIKKTGRKLDQPKKTNSYKRKQIIPKYFKEVSVISNVDSQTNNKKQVYQ